MIHISATPETLLDQAMMTANQYLRDAIDKINEAFDDETYASTHPELVAAFIRVASDDFRTSMTLKVFETQAEELLEVLRHLGRDIQDAER